MTIEELKSNNIKSLTDFELLTNGSKKQGLFYVPDIISNIIADFAKLIIPQNAIVLNSNYGEISSKLKDIENIVSIDINANNIELSKYLNPELTFINADPLNYSLSDKFDFVITFPPLGQRLESNGGSTSSEILYIEKALDLLNENGVAVFILSSNFLTAPIYADIRNLITTQFGLSKIIQLSQGAMRNVGTELFILIIKKSNLLKTDFYSANSNFEIRTAKPIFSIPKEELTERWDFNFHNPLSQKYQERLRESKTKKIGDLVEVCFGIHFNKEEKQASGNFKIISSRNIINGFLEETPNDNYFKKDNLTAREEKAILQIGDILFPRYNRDKVAVYIHSSDNGKFIASRDIFILRGKNAEYVAIYLNTVSGLNLFNQQIKRHEKGTVLPTISLQDLTNIQIPILPIKSLESASIRELEKNPIEKNISFKSELELLANQYVKIEMISFFEQNQSLIDKIDLVLKKQEEHTTKLINIENKIDDIKTVILKLSDDFKEIQSLPREIEEKILRLNMKLEEQISNLHFEQKQIDTYIKEIKNWFDYYDLLETKSKKYLPEAEYIFDHISKLDNPDYSPFILQYCRALENELLSKIFRAYVQSIIDRNIVFYEKFYWDLGKKESGKLNDENTFKLSKHIQKCLTKTNNEWFFELGSMEVNLRYLTGKTVEKSPLLQDLREFVLDHFEKELLNIEYLDEIKTIIRDYRNQSAHPNLMDTEKATTFHKQMKECLINLMENYKTK